MLTSALVLALIQAQDTVPVSLRSAGGARVAMEHSATGRFYATIALRIPSGVSPADAHLVEHLLTEQDSGRLLSDLEEVDVSVEAETTRTQMSFILSGPNGQESVVPDVLAKLSAPLKISADDLTHEVNVLQEEKALRPLWGLSIDKLYDSVWGVGSVFPDEAPTPDEVVKAQSDLWNQAGVAVSMNGAVSTRDFAARLVSLLEKMPAGTKSDAPAAKVKNWAEGNVVGIVAGPVGSLNYASAVGVALALSGRIPNTSAVMTDQCQSSLVTVTTSRDEVKHVVDQDREGLVAQAKVLSESWATQAVKDPAEANKIRASLLLTGRGRLSEFLDSAHFVTLAEINSTIDQFTGDGS